VLASDHASVALLLLANNYSKATNKEMPKRGLSKEWFKREDSVVLEEGLEVNKWEEFWWGSKE
jgi:hypothetical protein